MDRFAKLAHELDALRKLGFNSVADSFENNLRQAGIWDTVKEKMGFGKKEQPKPGSNMPQSQIKEEKRKLDEAKKKQEEETKQKQDAQNAKKDRAKTLTPFLDKGHALLQKALEGHIPEAQLNSKLGEYKGQFTEALVQYYKNHAGANPKELNNFMVAKVRNMVEKFLNTQKDTQKQRSQDKARQEQKNKGTVIDRKTGDVL